MTLTEFLLARIAEDEAVAQAAIDDDCGEDGGFEDKYEELIKPPSGVGIAQGGFGEAAARMIVRSTPRRLRAECEAKRRIVEEHGDGRSGEHIAPFCSTCSDDECLVDLPCPTLRILATVYADHPGHDEGWRP